MNTISAPAHRHRLLTAAALLALTGSAGLAQVPAPGAPAAPTVPAAPATTATTTTGLGGGAATDKPKPLAPSDKKFIKDAGKSIYFELQLADLVKTGAKEEGTKKIGDLVNRELNKAWEALGTIAKAKGETMPAELTGGDKGAAERLKKTKVEGFDKLFFREFLQTAKGLERDVISASKTAGDADIKNFAVNYQAIVKGHVTDGDKIEKNVGKKP